MSDYELIKIAREAQSNQENEATAILIEMLADRLASVVGE